MISRRAVVEREEVGAETGRLIAVRRSRGSPEVGLEEAACRLEVADVQGDVFDAHGSSKDGNMFVQV